jgi:DNA-binding HxlR family transcriptional regulator
VDKGYGQFCTVARGAEVLCEKWTPLVLRELLCGSRRFNELHRGVPRMSTALLSRRLRELEEVGVVRRVDAGSIRAYELTQAGEELRPLILGLGHWGARWIGSRLRDGELDAGFLMWDIRRFVRLEEFPQERVVILFDLYDAQPRERHWWLVVEDKVADLCRDDPGHVPTLQLESTVRALTEIWSGDTTPTEAARAKEIRVLGAKRDAESLWRWLGTSAFAGTRHAARVGVD